MPNEPYYDERIPGWVGGRPDVPLSWEPLCKQAQADLKRVLADHADEDTDCRNRMREPIGKEPCPDCKGGRMYFIGEETITCKTCKGRGERWIVDGDSYCVPTLAGDDGLVQMLIDKVKALPTRVAELEALVRSQAERIAGQSEILGRAAERDL